MKFGPVATRDANGAWLAHSVMAGSLRLRKGRLIGEADIRALLEAGITDIIAAQLDADDVHEDEAARRIARTLGQAGATAGVASTGRVNIHADFAGVLTVDATVVEALNTVNPTITLSTLFPFSRVTGGQMVATVKIIPFAVPRRFIELAEARLAGRPAFAVHRFRPWAVGLVQTELPGVKTSVLDKTARVTATRLDRHGSTVASERRVPHRADALASSIAAVASDADAVIVFGASAVTDPDDVVPSAIRQAGGRIERIGMPVDPGNLLVLGWLGDKPVIGAPGCARSPKENGFDWVVDRLCAGLDLTDLDIARMGVGGLLGEIATRPSPREGDNANSGLAIIVLAAGRSSRMGGPNKLLSRFDGETLVRRSVERATASSADTVVVVTGHQHDEVSRALAGTSARIVHNARFAEGLASSLKVGVKAAGDVAGVLVMLADMPGITTGDLDRILKAARDNPGALVRATCGGRRGNPVVLPELLLNAVQDLAGDAGARSLVESAGDDAVDVEIGAGAFLDVDTPEALTAAGGIVEG